MVCVGQELLGTHTGDARKLFGALDVNGDDAVSMEEWEALFAKMEQEPGFGVGKVHEIMVQLEISVREKDRKLTDAWSRRVESSSRVVTSHCRDPSSHRVRMMFHRLDRDDTGIVNQEVVGTCCVVCSETRYVWCRI